MNFFIHFSILLRFLKQSFASFYNNGNNPRNYLLIIFIIGLITFSLYRDISYIINIYIFVFLLNILGIILVNCGFISNKLFTSLFNLKSVYIRLTLPLILLLIPTNSMLVIVCIRVVTILIIFLLLREKLTIELLFKIIVLTTLVSFGIKFIQSDYCISFIYTLFILYTSYYEPSTNLGNVISNVKPSSKSSTNLDKSGPKASSTTNRTLRDRSGPTTRSTTNKKLKITTPVVDTLPPRSTSNSPFRPTIIRRNPIIEISRTPSPTEPIARSTTISRAPSPIVISETPSPIASRARSPITNIFRRVYIPSEPTRTIINEPRPSTPILPTKRDLPFEEGLPEPKKGALGFDRVSLNQASFYFSHPFVTKEVSMRPTLNDVTDTSFFDNTNSPSFIKTSDGRNIENPSYSRNTFEPASQTGFEPTFGNNPADPAVIQEYKDASKEKVEKHPTQETVNKLNRVCEVLKHIFNSKDYELPMGEFCNTKFQLAQRKYDIQFKKEHGTIHHEFTFTQLALIKINLSNYTFSPKGYFGFVKNGPFTVSGENAICLNGGTGTISRFTKHFESRYDAFHQKHLELINSQNNN